jgi:hypothetical protein
MKQQNRNSIYILYQYIEFKYKNGQNLKFKSRLHRELVINR